MLPVICPLLEGCPFAACPLAVDCPLTGVCPLTGDDPFTGGCPPAETCRFGMGCGSGSGARTHSIRGARSPEDLSEPVGAAAASGSSLLKRVSGGAGGGVLSTSFGCKESGSGVECWEDRPTAGNSSGDSLLISVAGR